MELSAIVKEYNVPLTRSERNLVSQLDTGASATSEDRYKQQMKELASAREIAKQLPDRQTSERQSKMARAAMLKERLKMLRQMIPFLSPSAAKSLKAEMQQIAAQVASLGGGGSGGTGSVVAATAETPSAESSESGNKVESPQDTAAQSDGTPQGADEAQQEQPASSGGSAQGHTQKSSADTTDDRQLNETVEELKSLYKAVMAALKRKQQAGRGGGQQADLSPTLRAYAATPDSTESIAVKA